MTSVNIISNFLSISRFIHKEFKRFKLKLTKPLNIEDLEIAIKGYGKKTRIVNKKEFTKLL
jgi:hypothetical protein